MMSLELLDARETRVGPRKRRVGYLYTRLFLKRGHEVLFNERQASQLSASMLRVEGGVTLIDHEVVLGRRQVIADGYSLPRFGVCRDGRWIGGRSVNFVRDGVIHRLHGKWCIPWSISELPGRSR